MSTELHSESASDGSYSTDCESLSISSQSSSSANSDQCMCLSPEKYPEESTVADMDGAVNIGSLNQEFDDQIDASDSSDDSSFDCYTDSEDEQVEDDLCIPYLYQPLYSGAEITMAGAICAIVQFCMTYKLPYTAIGGLLRPLIILYPTPNHLPKSFYTVKTKVWIAHHIAITPWVCLHTIKL